MVNKMGLFDKFKKIFKSEEVVQTKEEEKELELYDKGLEKTRNDFV